MGGDGGRVFRDPRFGGSLQSGAAASDLREILLGKVKPIAVIGSEDEARWHRERAKVVTKTDIKRLISGTLASKKAVYADKQGESPGFGGNEATRRGHAAEGRIATWVEREYGIPASQVLYVNGENRKHGATPDCFLWDDGEGALVEIKTTVEDWSAGLPRSIVDDALWQRYVLGAGYSAVAYMRFDNDGQPLTMTPTLVEVPADDERTLALIRAADDYLAWVDAGRPDADSDVPPDIRDKAEQIAHAKQVIADLDPVVKAWAAAQPNADTDGFKRTVPGAVIALTITRGKEFDEAAARSDHANVFDVYDTAAAVIADLKKDKQYLREKIGQRWSISAPKVEEVAA